MITFPPCKINLGLSVVARRPDGYHDIETCFYPLPWTDILEVIPSAKFAFTSSGNIIPGNESENLCVKAYELLKKDYNLPEANIHLHKMIPTGAGLGGGSSDAAHTIRLLNDVFSLALPAETMQKYAAQLGSDCAFFIQDQPMEGTGRGEQLAVIQVSLKGKFMVVLKPAVHVSTAEAYSGITPSKPALAVRKILETYPMETWKDHLKNDFEPSVFQRHTVIEELKFNLYKAGAIYASMSGSGSAVFGIFENPVNVTKPADVIQWKGIMP